MIGHRPGLFSGGLVTERRNILAEPTDSPLWADEVRQSWRTLLRNPDAAQASDTIDLAVVDAAILALPFLKDGAAFALDRATGAILCCAIVAKADHPIRRPTVRAALTRLLPASHVPAEISFVTSIPRGPGGRPRRLTLAQQVLSQRSAGIADAQPGSNAAELSKLEAELLELWRLLTGQPQLGPDEDYFSAGDEASARRMLLQVKAIHGLRYKISYEEFLYEPTVYHLAAMVRYGQEMGSPQPASHAMRIVRVSDPDPLPAGRNPKPALYLFPPDSDEGACFRLLSEGLGPDWPLSVVRPTGLLHRRGPYQIEEAARESAELIAADCGGRPFMLGGFCYGGLLAAETARLLAPGCQGLILFDTPIPGTPHYLFDLRQWRSHLRWARASLARSKHAGKLTAFSIMMLRKLAWQLICSGRPLLARVWDRRPFQAVARRALAGDVPVFYRLRPLPLATLHLLTLEDEQVFLREAALDWAQIIRGKLTVVEVAGAHRKLFSASNIKRIAREIDSWVSEVRT